MLSVLHNEMEHKIADYYDMPHELLPSANFAARPSSEISENSFLEGLWTFMISSSESESEAEDITTPTNRQPINASELPARWRSRSSNGAVASEEKANNSDAGSGNRHKGSVQRPRLREKVATAPPGTFSLQSFVPHQPRRVISAERKSSQIDKSRLPRALQNETDQRLTTKSAWSMPKWLSHDNDNSGGGSTSRSWNPLPSFSAKARVRRTLKEKKLPNVKTGVVAMGSKKILSAPLSVMKTPSEMYGIREDSATTYPRNEDSQQFPPLQSNEDKSSLSIRQCSARKTLSSTRPQHVYWSETGTRLKVYVPGRIRLERHSVWLRRDSVATLDPFDKTSETKNHANEADLDDIAAFFADMGVVDDTTNMGQDRFWLKESREEHHHTSPRRHSVSSLEKTSSDGTQTWNNPRIPRGSRFSFSSGSSGASNKPLSWGPIRQRIMLRRLLSPGHPGFHRTPAISEPHKDEVPLV